MQKRTEQLIKDGLSSEIKLSQELANELQRVNVRLGFVTRKSMRRRSLLKRLVEQTELYKHRWKNDRMSLNFYKTMFDEKPIRQYGVKPQELVYGFLVALAFGAGVALALH